MFNKENILGPFEAKGGLRLLAIDDESVYLIQLNLIALIKYSINIQLPLLFISHFEKLKSATIKELIEKYKHQKLTIDTNLKVKIERSKLWKHKIYIRKGQVDLKWNILDREAIKYYEFILSNSLHESFRTNRFE